MTDFFKFLVLSNGYLPMTLHSSLKSYSKSFERCLIFLKIITINYVKYLLHFKVSQHFYYINTKL